MEGDGVETERKSAGSRRLASGSDVGWGKGSPHIAVGKGSVSLTEGSRLTNLHAPISLQCCGVQEL